MHYKTVKSNKKLSPLIEVINIFSMVKKFYLKEWVLGKSSPGKFPFGKFPLIKLTPRIFPPRKTTTQEIPT